MSGNINPTEKVGTVFGKSSDSRGLTGFSPGGLLPERDMRTGGWVDGSAVKSIC